MRLELPPELLARVSIEEAIVQESAQPLGYLPSRVVETVFSERSADVLPILAGQLGGTVRVDPAEIVWVPKAGRVGRYRPITALTPLIRVLLRALELDLRTVIRPPDRSVASYRAFQTAVLELPDVTHVVVADVASFYFFLDHEVLESRVIEATARAETATTLRAVLTSLYERPLGIPQNFGPSALFSELCIAPVERKLIRHGIPAFRSNDDFRLAASTWGDALQYLEVLQEALAEVGLDLNAEKTWILKEETYRNNLSLTAQILDAAFRDSEADDDDLPTINPYTGEPIDPDDEGADDADNDALTDAMTRVFCEALAALRGDAGARLTPFEARANRDVIATALFYFTRQSSEAALDDGPRIVALDPLFAMPYLQYLRALPEDATGSRAASQVAAVFDAFRGHAPYWVQASLFGLLLRAESRLDVDVVKLLRSFVLGAAPSILRARGALALALHGEMSSHELAVLFEESTDAARPDLAVAAALLSDGDEPTGQLAAIVDSAPMLRLSFDYARAQLPDVSWI